MLLESLRALFKAPGRAGSIWEYLEAVVRATRVSRRFAYGFLTELHFADESFCLLCLTNPHKYKVTVFSLHCAIVLNCVTVVSSAVYVTVHSVSNGSIFGLFLL
jgi:hypothetical protein